MHTASDQTLFERFRARGDAAALGELFDRVAPALLRIALHLAPDPAAAEDLVQGTFLLAIEARSDWDATRPVLPWLCGILHNRARTARRQVTREPDPRRLPTRATDDPVRAAESAEFDAAVDAAIATLPEIYQPVLRLHLAYAHAPAEIAHALSRPAGTVRSQLARGLELLRNALPASLVGGLASCVGGGRGLAAVKQTVLAASTGVTPASAGLAALVGGTLMLKKSMLAVAVAAAAAITWFGWPHTPQVPRPLPSPTPGLTALDSPTTTMATEAPTADARRVAVADAAPITTGALKITCRFAEDLSPAWGALVSVTPLDVPLGDLLLREVTTDAAGVAYLRDLPPGQVQLTADRGGELRREVVSGRTIDAELLIPAGLDLRGRVVDERGAPAPGAQVWLSAGARNFSDGRQVARTDAGGRFALRAVQPDRFVSATSPGLRSAVVQPVRGEAGATVEVELVLRGAGVALLGKVVDAAGLAIPEALLLVGWRDRDLAWSPTLHAGYRPPTEVRTDARGDFRVDGLEPGGRTVVFARAHGYCATSTLVTLAPSGDTSITVQLGRGGTIAGQATDTAGQRDARVFVAAHATRLHGGDPDLGSYCPEWARSWALADATGRYRIEAVPPGAVRLLARSGEHEVRGEVALEEGAVATWNPTLAEVVLRGRVLDERDRALAGWEVMAQPPRGRGRLSGATTDAEGRFRCPATPGVPYVVTVYAARDAVRARRAAVLRGVLPSEELILRVPDALTPSASIAGTLLDADGRPTAKGRLRWCSAHGEGEVDVDPGTGRFRIQPLPSGSYRLQGSVDWRRRSSWSEPFTLAPREDRDVGIVQMPSPGSIVVTVAGPDGARLDGVSIALEDDTGWTASLFASTKAEHGVARIVDVAPGSRRVRVSGPDLPDVYAAVTVTANTETEVRIDVPAGVLVRLALAAVSEPAPIDVTFVWTRDDLMQERYVNWIEGVGEMTWPRMLVPGRYEVTATSETGKQAVSRFVVHPEDPPGRVIPITLP